MMVAYANYLFQIFMNVHENDRNEEKVQKNQGALLTKLLVFHLIIALEYQT